MEPPPRLSAKRPHDRGHRAHGSRLMKSPSPEPNFWAYRSAAATISSWSKTMNHKKPLNAVFVFAMILLLAIEVASAATPSTGPTETAKATFAGGCFWCMEPPYDKLDGVISTIS